MQEISGPEQADLSSTNDAGAVQRANDDSAREPVTWHVGRPHLRLVVDNPRPRESRRPDAVALKSRGDLAGRLANSWTTAFSDDESFDLHSATTLSQDACREPAPITPLFPHRHP